MDELAGDIRLMSAALGQDVATWNEETYTIDVTEIEVARRVAVGVQATDFRFTDSRRLDEHSYEFVFATIRDQRQVTIRLIGCIVSHPGWELVLHDDDSDSWKRPSHRTAHWLEDGAEAEIALADAELEWPSTDWKLRPTLLP
jgi:hypothetical protein